MKNTNSTPPGWGSDRLSEFVDIARQNIFATFHNLKIEYGRLVEIDKIYRDIIDNLINTPEWFAGFFLLLAHSSYLGGVRLSISGQIPESYMVFRGCIENSLYGLYLSHNPKSRITWLKRHDDEKSMREVKNEFTIKNLLDLLKSLDSKIFDVTSHLYKRTIDYGAHPNERALSSSIKITEEKKSTRFDLNYLTGHDLSLELCLKTNAQIGVCSLDIFRCVYKERFDILGLTKRLDMLKKEL